MSTISQQRAEEEMDGKASEDPRLIVQTRQELFHSTMGWVRYYHEKGKIKEAQASLRIAWKFWQTP